jgi:hypothetical protein
MGSGERNQNVGVSELITEYKELLRGLSLKDDVLIKRSLAVLRVYTLPLRVASASQAGTAPDGWRNTSCDW